MSTAPAETSPSDWRAESVRRIEQHRKGDFALTLRKPDGKPLANTEVRVRLARHEFLFGTAVAVGRLAEAGEDGRRYREFLSSHFSGLVDENSMKWYHVEKVRGQLDFVKADLLADFARDHDLALRGHCLLWAKTKYLPEWARALPGPELEPLALAQVRRMAERYRGRLAAWDVNNEMLDGQHFSQTIRAGIDAEFFKTAHAADPGTPLFVNEYHILDSDERTAKYLELILALRGQGAPVGGIGVQEHAAERLAPAPAPADGEAAGERVERQSRAALVPADMWARLDRLAATGLPIHLTEISAKTKDETRKAEALEAFFRTGFAHPGVEAIFLWGFWEKAHWMGRDAALVDAQWNPLPAGHRIFQDLLGKEWNTDLALQTDADGTVKFRGFFGSYTVAAGNQPPVPVRFRRNDPRAAVARPSN